MIEAHISPEMQAAMSEMSAAGGDMSQVPGDSIFPVLNMLNAKYFIVGLQDGQTKPLTNPYAYGNAWWVDNVEYGAKANEEIEGVGKVNLGEVAVDDKQFEKIPGQSAAHGATDVVTMTA